MNTDYRHLNVDERVFIQLALERGCTLRAIARSVQRSELISCLRQARRRRLPRARGEDRRGKITNRVSIHMRPPEIEERIIPGHWEGDLIKGIRGKSVVGTLVERSTLFVTLAKIR